MLIKSKNQHGGDIYSKQVMLDYSANTSPLGTPQSVKQAIIESAEQVCAYPDTYCTQLRENISCYENVEKDHIICGNGAADVIFSFAYALKPKNALIVCPTFSEYENALRATGCNVEKYILSQSDSFCVTQDLLQCIKGKDVVFICNPNNPTGVLTGKDFMKKLLKKCSDEKAKLFVDECFMDMTDMPKDYTMVTETMNNKYIFILKAFTKSFGMAGVRLGYGICSDENLLEKMSQSQQVWNVSTVAQHAGCAALKEKQFLTKLRTLVKNERKFLSDSLTQLGFKVFKGSANFILFQGENNLYEKLSEQGIMIRRCANFAGLDDSFYRCAVKNHEDNIKFIKALKEREI